MSDGKEVKRFSGKALPRFKYESEPIDDVIQEQFFVKAEDHDQIVAELKNEMAAIRAQGYNDWRMDLKRANETIAELRAKLDVEQFAHGYDVNQLNERVESLTKKLSNSLAEVVELKEGNYAFSEQIAKQRYNIDELRAEVFAVNHKLDKHRAANKMLETTIARQSKVIARAVKALNEYRCSSCLNRDELNCYRYEACSSYKELAAIEKEGAK